MNFNDNIPISRQLVEYCYTQVMTGGWSCGERIPSTKDMAVMLGVNPRTVMKAYDELAEAGIIYQRRGMGYYTADDARETIIKKRRETFVRNTIPELRRTMDELGYTPQDILNLLNDQNTENNHKINA